MLVLLSRCAILDIVRRKDMSLDHLTNEELIAAYIALSAEMEDLPTLPLYSSLESLLAALENES